MRRQPRIPELRETVYSFELTEILPWWTSRQHGSGNKTEPPDFVLLAGPTEFSLYFETDHPIREPICSLHSASRRMSKELPVLSVSAKKLVALLVLIPLSRFVACGRGWWPAFQE